MMKYTAAVFFAFIFMMTSGCAPVLIGGAATGGYKLATDERSVKEIWKDTELANLVRSELINAPDINSAKIDIDSVDHVIILTGVVKTMEEATLSEKLAWNVSGVKGVKNQLQVGEKTIGEAIDDKITGSRVKTRLMAEPGIRSMNIDVDVHKGVVTLSGILSSAELKRKAVDLATATKGVKRLVDNIIIKGE